MSSRRIVQSLGGTNSLSQDTGTKARPQAFWHDQIDTLPHNLLEPDLNPSEIEEAQGMVELDQDVDVAVRSGFVARDRAEQRELRCTHRRQLVTMLG